MASVYCCPASPVVFMTHQTPRTIRPKRTNAVIVFIIAPPFALALAAIVECPFLQENMAEPFMGLHYLFCEGLIELLRLLSQFIGQCAEVFDGTFYGVTTLQESAGGHSDARRCAGGYNIARLKRH